MFDQQTMDSHRAVISGLVSTIIPVYNRAIFLHEAVESVALQDYPAKEIILVDDGSTDGTESTVRQLAEAYPELIRSVRINNIGPGGARESGRQLARGEFLQYLDSDDRLLPNKFAHQVAALRNAPGCGIAYGKTRLINEEGEVLVAPYKRSGVKLDFLFPELLIERWWNTHTPLYRRSLSDRVGSWTDMRMAEDWQYDARMGALKTPLAYCDCFVSDHREHQHERLTGGKLTAGALKDFGRLMPTLLECAFKAGVSVGHPAMCHYSRWAFSIARRLAAAGERKFAAECLSAAVKADKAQGIGVDFRLFKAIASILGWRAAGAITERMYLLKSLSKTRSNRRSRVE